MGKYLKEFSKGIVKENPVFRLCLGTCPTLAISTTLSGSIGMGLAATLVLICSNTFISLLRKVIPDKIRIPAYITVIAGFVTIVQMLVQAFMPALNATLGIYLPLIVVNCIILGRAEAFAGKNPVLLSALDGLGMGIGFTISISIMGFIRELLGSGTVLGHAVGNPPMLVFVMAPGGFFVFGMMVALVNAISKKRGKKPIEKVGVAPAGRVDHAGGQARQVHRFVTRCGEDAVAPHAQEHALYTLCQQRRDHALR